MRGVVVVAVALLGFCAGGSREAAAMVFSVDPASPSSAFVSPADLLTPGPPGGPPVVAFSFLALGLAFGDDVNALSFGTFVGTEVFFSVDRGAGGQAGTAVASEAAAGQPAGDIFADRFPIVLDHTNSLVANQDALGLLPAIPAGSATAALLDNIDALDMDPPSAVDLNGDGIPDLPIFFSLAPGSPTLGLIGASPADILSTFGGAQPTVAVSAATLGLSTLDDIDALVFDPGNVTPLISLAPGSPTLALLPGSPADIFAPLISPPGFLGPSLLLGTISSLGLLTTDDVTAFSDGILAPRDVAEPADTTALWLALAGVGLVRLGARRVQRRNASRGGDARAG